MKLLLLILAVVFIQLDTSAGLWEDMKARARKRAKQKSCAWCQRDHSPGTPIFEKVKMPIINSETGKIEYKEQLIECRAIHECEMSGDYWEGARRALVKRTFGPGVYLVWERLEPVKLQQTIPTEIK